VTEQEIAVLRALCRSDHMGYIPRGPSTTALREFDDLVLSLYGMKKMGLIELEVEKGGKAVKGYKPVPSSSGSVHETRSGGAQDAGGDIIGVGIRWRRHRTQSIVAVPKLGKGRAD
jgi:hypothetical protein